MKTREPQAEGPPVRRRGRGKIGYQLQPLDVTARDEAALLQSVGHQIRAQREEIRAPRLPVAKCADISNKTMIDLEAGVGNPTITKLWRVLLALGMTELHLPKPRGGGQIKVTIDESIVDPAENLLAARSLLQNMMEQLVTAFDHLDRSGQFPKISILPGNVPIATDVFLGNSVRMPPGGKASAILHTVSHSVPRVRARVTAKVHPLGPIEPLGEAEMYTVEVPDFVPNRADMIAVVEGDGFSEWQIADGDVIVIEECEESVLRPLDTIVVTVRGESMIGHYLRDGESRYLLGPDGGRRVDLTREAWELRGLLIWRLRSGAQVSPQA